MLWDGVGVRSLFLLLLPWGRVPSFPGPQHLPRVPGCLGTVLLHHGAPWRLHEVREGLAVGEAEVANQQPWGPGAFYTPPHVMREGKWSLES